ncbi:hypothetical protein FHS83_001082 [Rhizomicrobium palustre]|uniref:Alpha-galactosidase n=1 Tax=Rhizomicrobium palustre TaxID=189966 RepID=A0A846MW71_9PROT|nr:glycoside hydrolase family 27 protein [Rhizomicrobium palustre]NIK87764.1 hypothetical protein [Rhizomicrobium palustre]
MRLLPILAAATCLAGTAFAATLAPTPPMGWNSWDAYGLTITEAQFRENVAELVKLKPYGWTYAVIDEGWYMENPFGKGLAERKYKLDGNGLLLPALSRFPSAEKADGLKPLGDYVHAQGLKFGVHVIRGIPKDAVTANLPIAGTTFKAADAADTTDLCPWDDGNFGIKDNAAGQAYYDTMVKKYADWGVDFIKVDCIADHPYKPKEIRQIAKAIKNSGREIVLSLSPGPTNISHAAEVGELAQMWRIADDSWDSWSFKPANWPNGLETGFEKLAEWSQYAKPGNWPDADMLPFGSLTPNPGWGEARQSRLTPEETKSWFTLWAIARSPLILGANLTKLDEPLKALLTNKELIAVNQTAWESHAVNYKSGDTLVVWEAKTGPREKPVVYRAYFNLAKTDVDLSISLTEPKKYISLFDGKDYAVAAPDGKKRLQAKLSPHASAIFRVE